MTSNISHMKFHDLKVSLRKDTRKYISEETSEHASLLTFPGGYLGLADIELKERITWGGTVNFLNRLLLRKKFRPLASQNRTTAQMEIPIQKRMRDCRTQELSDLVPFQVFGELGEDPYIESSCGSPVNHGHGNDTDLYLLPKERKSMKIRKLREKRAVVDGSKWGMSWKLQDSDTWSISNHFEILSMRKATLLRYSTQTISSIWIPSSRDEKWCLSYATGQELPKAPWRLEPRMSVCKDGNCSVIYANDLPSASYMFRAEITVRNKAVGSCKTEQTSNI